jgi:hypothetical protein
MNADQSAMLPTRGLMSGSDSATGNQRPGGHLRLCPCAAEGAADAALQSSRGRTVNRMLHIDESAADLLNKLEAVRLLCQETGCAQRYLAHDALNAINQALRARRRRNRQQRAGRASPLTSSMSRTTTWRSASP